MKPPYACENCGQPTTRTRFCCRACEKAYNAGYGDKALRDLQAEVARIKGEDTQP